MKHIKYLMIYLLCAFSSTTFARYIYVDIMNKTNGVCTLLNQHLLSGNQDSLVPLNIDKNTSQTFILYQSLSRGPKIELTYSCNNKMIQFTCNQVTTFFGYGDLYANLLSAQEGITASFDTINPSLKQIGRIHVTLIENSAR